MWIETYRKCVLVVCWDKGGTSVARKNREKIEEIGEEICVFLLRAAVFLCVLTM